MSRLVFILLFVAATGRSFSPALGQSGFSFGAAPNVAQALAARGVPADHESLMKAMRSADELTQSLAATELAYQRANEAIPYITMAFESDKESIPRFNLAQAVSMLDAPRGRSMLISLCKNSRDRGSVRLSATQLIEDAGMNDCDAAISDVALNSEEPATKLMALTLLEGKRFITTDNRLRFRVEAKLLNDENNSVRVASAKALKRSGDPDATAEIQRRISVEPNNEVAEDLRRIAARSAPDINDVR